MPELIVMRRGVEVGRHVLGVRPLSLGRHESNDVVVADGKVSRRHARISRTEQGWVFDDLDSHNGSYVGDRRVRRHLLRDGDVIRLGEHELRYQVAGRVAPPPLEPDPLLEPSLTELDGSWESLHASLSYSLAGGARRLQALFEISSALDQAEDFGAVLVQILDLAIRTMGGERGLLLLEDPATGELQVRVARNLSGDDSQTADETVSRTVVDRVVQTAKPVLVVDAPRSAEWASESILAEAIHSAVCAPLTERGRVVGVLYVDDRRSRGGFTELDLAFFTTLAIQAKAAIDASRAYWELVDSLFRASDDPVVVCSRDGRITQVNAATARQAGVEAKRLVGRRVEEVLCPGEVARGLVDKILEGGVASGRELDLVGADGARVPLSVSGFALRERGGQPFGLCLIGRDLSELKALIHRLEVRNDFIRGVFGRYLSDEVVEDLLSAPERLRLGGEKRRLTILMSDLRGFTSLAEQLPPEQVVSVLNRYLAVMVEVITAHRGTIDEIIGDALLVLFGAPILRGDDARRAVACAVDMQLAMEEVNRASRELGLPELEMGVAVVTGDVVVGNIGSEKRSKYAVVGSSVNLAGRLESRTVGGQILIADSTRLEVGDAAILGERREYLFKGMDRPVVAWELRGVQGPSERLLATVHDVLDEVVGELVARCALVVDKQVQAEGFPVRVVGLGPVGLELDSPRPLFEQDDVVLSFTGGPDGMVQAKVVGGTPERPRLRFTSVPPAVRAWLTARG